MAQFLFQVAYTRDSWATQVRERGNVLERIQPLIDGCNGSVSSCFYAFGDYDLILLADFPGDEEAAAFSLAATAGGSVKNIKTTPLLTVDQGISAMHRANEAGRAYHPPVDHPAHQPG
ncbi:MAG: GYD domain-containing protein [Nocardioidaceae bacterium]